MNAEGAGPGAAGCLVALAFGVAAAVLGGLAAAWFGVQPAGAAHIGLVFGPALFGACVGLTWKANTGEPVTLREAYDRVFAGFLATAAVIAGLGLAVWLALAAWGWASERYDRHERETWIEDCAKHSEIRDCERRLRQLRSR